MTMINTARPYTQNFGKKLPKLPSNFRQAFNTDLHIRPRNMSETKKMMTRALWAKLAQPFQKLDKTIEKQMIKLHGSKEKYYAHLQKSWDREIAMREFMGAPLQHIKAFIAKYRGKA